nr:hypothetical protein [Sphingomonas sp. CDS-1]
MSRRRTNDPLGVSDCPNITTDPDREKILVAEFRKRLDYALKSYVMWRRAFGPPSSFNDSLNRLERGLSSRVRSNDRKRRLHPEIEAVISHHAKQHAAERSGMPNAVPTSEDIDAGARKALALLKPRRGRPDDRVLTHHVEGLMALIQNYLGKPVMLQTKTNSVYDPQATNGAGEILLMIVKDMEPRASRRRIVTIVDEARRHYAGKRMHFFDFFPGYGARMDEETGEIKLRPGLQLQQMNLAAPIYCG